MINKSLHYDELTKELRYGAVVLAKRVTPEGRGVITMPNRDLYFDEQFIAVGNVNYQTGFTYENRDLYYDGKRVNVTVTPPVDPEEPEIPPIPTQPHSPLVAKIEPLYPEEFEGGIWIAPPQPERPLHGDEPDVKYAYTTQNIIDWYDALCELEPRLTKHIYSDKNGDPITVGYPYYYDRVPKEPLPYPTVQHKLIHYLYEPPNYKRTLFLQAGIHGNERDAVWELYRMIEIMIKHHNEDGYKLWQQVYDNCRIIIIPVMSPWDYSRPNPTFCYINEEGYAVSIHATKRVRVVGQGSVPHEANTAGINLNRNFDYNHAKNLASSGTGGYFPLEMVEVQHTRDVMLKYRPHTIDMLVDYHDGPAVNMHYWINHGVDAPNRTLVMDNVHRLIEHYNIQDPIISECADNWATGIVMGWGSKRWACSSSTGEYIGGIFGYNFDSAMLTHSLTVRATSIFNALFNDIRGWLVREPENAQYFQFDFPMAFVREDMRERMVSEPKTFITTQIIENRWNTLSRQHPTKVKKSTQLFGVNQEGHEIYSYTFGNGAKKVLWVGGIKHFGSVINQTVNTIEHYGFATMLDEFAMYLLVEYLCNDYIVNQSKFLQDLRDNYTIVVLPYIDLVAVNTQASKGGGLNNLFGTERWGVVNGKTVLNDTENTSCQAVKAFIDTHSDAACLVSGSEFNTGYSGAPPLYGTDYGCQFILPKGMTADLDDYATYLRDVRLEKSVVIEHTSGKTFADYAYSQYGIPCYYAQQKVSYRYEALKDFHNFTVSQYLCNNYEAGRRMANIANLLMMH